MASSSTIPLVNIDDEEDDDFDWDAAVREIDVACQSSKPSTSSENPYETPRVAPSDALFGTAKVPYAFSKKSNGASRQSTLDKFIGRSGTRADSENAPTRIEEQEYINSNSGTSCVEIDAEAAKTWIYPVNVPLRNYQFAITKTALFSNTLVALPTGLGKTLIAAVVMFNYFRWFPEGKIVFTAPSRPLVMQQIEACHNVVGIPQEWTIDMTGQMSPVKRVHFWKSKRVFFVTPQVLEKDIQSGTCLVNHLVCLVIDEAHRALGNYSYCVVVRELMAIPVQLRILALTATPGSKHQTIQHVIDNLIISTLEYRTESDPDVSPYVHDRKIELIEVAMGKEAIEINDLLLKVIRIYAARLNAMGILLNRDYQALSPSDLLNSRDKFRQAPPPELPQMKYGEVERYFGALITLYHIRKLLSSHGIRPAYEMLEEKLQQGSFASLMSRNEDIYKAKLLMQQTLSLGAPNPKLSKMLEVLIDHFKTSDSQQSRVIIFSNFRGSVRDIMDALSNVGDIVKAAQFVGQSSGKSLKGQSQKVQQAVLEKFRAGGYNVIVATSIGEEGLDIMEVDLVICFDANVSPLRMVQRMGRTGRKHSGRVVVLACEGSELKGYMRKQANSKAVKKHMRNGGIASFNFLSSPRMIPHIFKPDVQFVELAIEKFVPRGKKVTEVDVVETPGWKRNLTSEETDMITKFFHDSGNKWRPSLIAFPHFQTFPSRVHVVMHSCRTSMLIDAMQHLQGVNLLPDKDSLSVEESDSLTRQRGTQSIGQCDGGIDLLNIDDDSVANRRSPSNIEAAPICSSETADNCCLSNVPGRNPQTHSYLFGSDYVSVDALGNVLILSVPSLPFKEIAQGCDHNLKRPKRDCGNSVASAQRREVPMEVGHSVQHVSSQARYPMSETWATCTISVFEGPQNEPAVMCKNSRIETINEVPLDEVDGTNGMPKTFNPEESFPLADGFNSDIADVELSPRLTNYMESGVVPESPVDGERNSEGQSEFVIPDPLPPLESSGDCLLMPSSQGKRKELMTETDPCREVISGSPSYVRVETPLGNIEDGSNGGKYGYASPVDRTPSERVFNGSCSKDWCLTPKSNSDSAKHRLKLKRLRRVGDGVSNRDLKHMDDRTVPIIELVRSVSGASTVQNNYYEGKRKAAKAARAYIEEEAEVSSEVEASEDEEDDLEADAYEDSFIDDTTNPTAASTQDATSTVDMMAVYRRSLLSQSPNVWQMTESKSSSGKSLCSPYAPQNGPTNQSDGKSTGSLPENLEKICKPIPCPARTSPTDAASNVESKKRKLRFHHRDSVTAINLERVFMSQEDVRKEGPVHQEASADCEPFSDDHFYEGLDLDALEAQATSLLQQRCDFSQEKKEMIPKSGFPSADYLSSPSFDLGI